METKKVQALSDTHPVILFDGVCNLCDSFVQFIIKRDKKGIFKFASLQSDVGQELLSESEINPNELSTVVMVYKNNYYTHSRVPLEVVKRFGGLWPLLYGFVIVPSSLRNAIYNWVARNRYKWFGKKDACMMPTPDIRQRFLDW